MRTSSTQHSTFVLCPRKWWFFYPQAVPGVMTAALTYGTTLHKCVELFFRGKDPYPPGWDDELESDEERGRIMAAVNKAITEGAFSVANLVGVEQNFFMRFPSGDEFTGLIDVLTEDAIFDHKSMKSLRWAESPRTLAENLQMLAYAKYLLTWRDQQKRPPLEEVRLVHNQFSKDPEDPLFRRVECKVTREQIEQAWAERNLEAGTMRHLAETHRNLLGWKDVPGPTSHRACQAFGGCPMQSVCSGQECPKKYSERILQTRRTGVESSVSEEDSEAMSSLLQRLRDLEMKKNPSVQVNGGKALPSPASPEPSRPPEAPVPVVQAEAHEASSAPWASPECQGCGGLGFNSKGGPCRACEMQSGIHVHGEFDLWRDGDRICFREKGIPSALTQFVLAPALAPAPAPASAPPPPSPMTGGSRLARLAAQQIAKAAASVPATAPASVVNPPSPLPPPLSPAPSPPPLAPPPPTQVVETLEEVDEADESDGNEVDKSGVVNRPLSERLQMEMPEVRADLTSGGKVGRKSQRFSLYVNCAPTFGRSKVVRLEREFLAWVNERVMPVKAPGKSYYHLPFFDRQKIVEAVIGDFITLLGTAHVVAITGDQDSRYLVGILRSFASVVVESVTP